MVIRENYNAYYERNGGLSCESRMKIHAVSLLIFMKGEYVMKIKVTIEEVISQTFEVEVSSIENAYDEVRNKYRNYELVVDNPELIEANLTIFDEDGSPSDFMNLHVN